MSNGRPWARQPSGKLRFRSTPCAFWRVPAAAPSGLRLGISQSCTPAGTGPARSARMTAPPAGSLPWIAPTTSTRRGARGSPDPRQADGAALDAAPEHRLAHQRALRRGHGVRGRRREDGEHRDGDRRERPAPHPASATPTMRSISPKPGSQTAGSFTSTPSAPSSSVGPADPPAERKPM